MSVVSVNSYTHSVTYVADNILKSFKDIIRESGLSPSKFADNWDVNQRGIRSWLESGHLRRIVLEIFHPVTGALILRWDLERMVRGRRHILYRYRATEIRDPKGGRGARRCQI
jgi:hypothetical protein